ncbi:MAG: YggS family pyridoxal phosphate-dependent enzyme [Alphaproteobacteria bacterium]|nr:YggS family pyridoxal phosphate-dependent enzyme [Alphaproteobacteria bacterium]
MAETAEATRANVAANLAAVRARIADAAALADRDPDDITLVAISKMQSEERVRAALEAGHRVFGENRIQEAQARWTALRGEYPDVALHFVGHLQSNKAAEVVALCDVIESVDRPKLARALAREMERQNRHPRCFIQVNTGEEPQKGGVAPAEAAALLALCRDELAIEVVGLMCIPPADQEPAPHFALLATMAHEFGLAALSMGMSGDYETGVRLGATHVRVGTAIFGPRSPR